MSYFELYGIYVIQSGLTPLHVGAYMGYANVVSLLLDNGASTEAVSIRNETPLHVAVRQRHYDVISILLRHRANINAVTNVNDLGTFDLFPNLNSGH